MPISAETISAKAGELIPGTNETATEDFSILKVTELASLPSNHPVPLLDWINSNQQDTESPETAQIQSADLSLYQEEVRKLELANGPFAEELPEQLLSLATVLQANGELDSALEYLERASHIARINHGLFSREQIPVIEKIVDNYLLRGDLGGAHAQREYLFFLQQKNQGEANIELLPALESFAEWNMFAFSAQPNSAIDPDTPDANAGPQVVTTTIDELVFRLQRLINAQNTYWAILQILKDNFGSGDPRVAEMEMRLALTNYYYESTMNDSISRYDMSKYLYGTDFLKLDGVPPPSVNNLGYLQGRDALERRLEYLQSKEPEDIHARAKASLDLADWMLFFTRHRGSALKHYNELYQELQAELDDEQFQSLFSPAYPQLLPTFIYPVYSRKALGVPEDQALAYQGYIDIQFTLNRYGKTRNLEVLSMTENTPAVISRLLTRNLRNAQFRPRLSEGEPAKEDLIQARYYYAY